MKMSKRPVTRFLEKLFPKTMHRFWWDARATGQKYGVNLALFVMHEEMRRLHKETDISLMRVKAKEQAKYLQTLIRQVRELNNVE